MLFHNILAAAVTVPSQVLYSRAAVDDPPGSLAEALATFPESGDTLQKPDEFRRSQGRGPARIVARISWHQARRPSDC